MYLPILLVSTMTLPIPYPTKTSRSRRSASVADTPRQTWVVAAGGDVAADAELQQGARLGAEAVMEDNLELHRAAGTKLTKQGLNHLTHRFRLRTPPRDLTHLAQTHQTRNRNQNRKLHLPRLRTTPTTASAN